MPVLYEKPRKIGSVQAFLYKVQSRNVLKENHPENKNNKFRLQTLITDIKRRQAIPAEDMLAPLAHHLRTSFILL